ncbi:MAG: c-type cytochrome, partial [Myxococcota bacterium]
MRPLAALTMVGVWSVAGVLGCRTADGSLFRRADAGDRGGDATAADGEMRDGAIPIPPPVVGVGRGTTGFFFGCEQVPTPDYQPALGSTSAPFRELCASCHRVNGQGVEGFYPSLMPPPALSEMR